ncbi:hypothetical protein SAMN04487948_104464 [Halogranum amylolyticum]|uniref:Uncharacterized protein n=1 Tax=Halogranum amylolyticum TaxID=660520 RepID=A0A1H8S629_9EURY|nr:hypothetical protein [Halogranum amylolyticum]SEO73748.1 hypothetical protein SAMN04487948_104464 [Halogranum amylolyticum]
MRQPSRLVLGVVLGLFVGVAVGGVGASVVGPLFGSPDSTTPEGPDPADPPRSLATGTGCLPANDTDTGWAHEVASGMSRTFTANLSVTHAPNETVNVSFEVSQPGSYVLAVDVVDGGKEGSPDCPTGSTVEFAASLPTEYERVEIVVDGQTVETVENDGDTTADLWTFAWNQSDGEGR